MESSKDVLHFSPVHILEGSDEVALAFSQISCGAFHNGAITEGGELFTWGQGDDGRLGHGGNASVATPTLVKTLEGLTVVQVSAGYCHTGAVTASGQLYMWGSNEDGQLGFSDGKSRSVPSICSQLTHRMQVRMVACGAFHSLVAGMDGQVYSCGDGSYGRTGLGDESLRSSFTRVTSLSDIVYISAGDRHSAAIDGRGVLFTFGNGAGGRLGHGDEVTLMEPQLIKDFYSSGTQIQSVDCGKDHTVCISTNGEVYSWGDGSHGKLGHGNDYTYLSPAKIESVSAKRGYKCLALSAGPFHTLLLVERVERGGILSLSRKKTVSTVVLSWGKNKDGVLGYGEAGADIDSTTPQEVVIAQGEDEGKPLAVSAGGKHSAIILSNGRIYLCGKGVSNQLVPPPSKMKPSSPSKRAGASVINNNTSPSSSFRQPNPFKENPLTPVIMGGKKRRRNRNNPPASSNLFSDDKEADNFEEEDKWNGRKLAELKRANSLIGNLTPGRIVTPAAARDTDSGNHDVDPALEEKLTEAVAPLRAVPFEDRKIFVDEALNLQEVLSKPKLQSTFDIGEINSLNESSAVSIQTVARDTYSLLSTILDSRSSQSADSVKTTIERKLQEVAFHRRGLESRLPQLSAALQDSTEREVMLKTVRESFSDSPYPTNRGVTTDTLSKSVVSYQSWKYHLDEMMFPFRSNVVKALNDLAFALQEEKQAMDTLCVGAMKIDGEECASNLIAVATSLSSQINAGVLYRDGTSYCQTLERTLELFRKSITTALQIEGILETVSRDVLANLRNTSDAVNSRSVLSVLLDRISALVDSTTRDNRPTKRPSTVKASPFDADRPSFAPHTPEAPKMNRSAGNSASRPGMKAISTILSNEDTGSPASPTKKFSRLERLISDESIGSSSPSVRARARSNSQESPRWQAAKNRRILNGLEVFDSPKTPRTPASASKTPKGQQFSRWVDRKESDASSTVTLEFDVADTSVMNNHRRSVFGNARGAMVGSPKKGIQNAGQSSKLLVPSLEPAIIRSNLRQSYLADIPENLTARDSARTDNSVRSPHYKTLSPPPLNSNEAAVSVPPPPPGVPPAKIRPTVPHVRPVTAQPIPSASMLKDNSVASPRRLQSSSSPRKMQRPNLSMNLLKEIQSGNTSLKKVESKSATAPGRMAGRGTDTDTTRTAGGGGAQSAKHATTKGPQTMQSMLANALTKRRVMVANTPAHGRNISNMFGINDWEI